MAKAANKPTQVQQVYGYMLTNGSITQLEAINEFGCMRLGARIWDIRHKLGVPVRKITEKGHNRFGEPTSYARYELVGEDE